MERLHGSPVGLYSVSRLPPETSLLNVLKLTQKSSHGGCGVAGTPQASGTPQGIVGAERGSGGGAQQLDKPLLPGERRPHVGLAAAAKAIGSAHLLAARPRVPFLLQLP